MSLKSILVIVGVILVILTISGVLAFKFLLGGISPVTLTYYGLWEQDSVFAEVISDFQKKHPNVTVKYQKQSPLNYRDRITASMATDTGPDIVRIHNTWLPMMINQLSSSPADLFSANSFAGTFYPIASSDLTSGGKVWAVPLEIDGLVMFVNQDLMTAGGVIVPKTWEDFGGATARLTVKDGNGRIQTSGTALGAASNVDHWQDILTLMMMQAGVDLTNQPNSQSAAEVMAFYTGFVGANRTWDETQDPSTLAFANGKVAMYFGPSWRYFDIKSINPNLNVMIAPVPQLSGGKTINLASYWAEGVSKKSKHPKEAWEFLQFISSKEELSKLYSAESKQRNFGEPYSRVDMGSLLASDPVAGVVVAEAPTMQSWYLASSTNDGDTGINSRIGKYYLDAINTINANGDVRNAVSTAGLGTQQVLSQYGLVSAPSQNSQSP